MDCQESREQISRYVDEEMGLDERRRLERHLKGCPACDDELAALRRLGALVRAGDPASGLPDAPAADFRQATLGAARILQGRAAGNTRRRRIVWSVPFAAAIAIAAGAWALRSASVPPQPMHVPPQAAAAVPVPATPLELYRENLAFLSANDTLAHYKLGLWCDSQGLAVEATERFAHVLRLDPNHAPTRSKLDHIRIRGDWRTRTEALAQGWQQYRGTWVTAEEREKLAQGLHFRDGRWMSPEEILTGKGYVCFAGLWVTPAQRDALEREQRLGVRAADGEEVVRGIATSLAPDALRPLEGVVIGEPRTYAQLSVFPLLSREAGESPVLSLEEAAREGKISVSDRGQVEVWNQGEKPVFFASGQMLEGGHQDRMNLRSLVVAPGRRALIDVRCCERNRSAGPSSEFSGFASLAPTSVRRLALAGDQERIWGGVDQLLRGLGASAPSSAMRAGFEAPAYVEKAKGYHGALARVGVDPRGRCVGAVGVIAGRVASIDLFGGENLFRETWPKLLSSWIADAVQESGAETAAPSRRWVRSVVERLAFARYRPLPITLDQVESGESRGQQELHAIEADFGAQERIEGQALVYEGRAVHVSVFSGTKD